MFLANPWLLDFVAFIFIYATVNSLTLLNPHVATIYEYDSVNFTCSSNVSTRPSSFWFINNMSNTATMQLVNGKCISVGFINSTEYNATCNSPNSFTLHIKNVTRQRHNQGWRCRFGINESGISYIIVNVKVSKVSIQLKTESPLTEYATAEFTCNTSYSRPRPTVEWFLINETGSVRKIQQGQGHISNNTTEYADLFSVLSTLRYNVSRELNGSSVYCSTADNDEIKSASIVLDILYPPDGPPEISKFPNGSTYRVIETDLIKLSCSVKGGNPTPALFWDCYKPNITAESILNEVITSGIELTASRNQTFCTCRSTHKLVSESTTVNLDILYPPTIPNINVSNSMGNEINACQQTDILETESIELECNSKSKPEPSYKWFVNETDKVQDNILNLTHARRSDTGTYTCHVHNSMNRTFGEVTLGNNSSSTFLNVLYPTDIGSLSNKSLEEGSILNITCPFIPGNPSRTEIIWTTGSDNRRWNNSQLLILNVTKADDTVYNCTVYSTMNSSFGISNVIERNSEFHLNVFYSVVIKQFVLMGKESQPYFIVNQTEKVSIICDVDGNPASNITIRNPQRKQIDIGHNVNTLQSSLRNASYLNAGEYMCTGRNNYTIGEAPSLNLILIVRCPPKPSSDITNDVKIATTLHGNATLQFTVQEYLDELNKTTFIWLKDNFTLESDDSKIVISSNESQSTLCIKNITQTDFGHYKVCVTNSVGQYIHVYQVLAEGKPEAPKDLSCINDSITDSSVTFKWMPGFNGGLSQTFVLLHKRIVDTHWQNISNIDASEEETNYTLYGLLSMTEYQVKIFARNGKGDSPITESLQFKTKAPDRIPIESHTSNLISIVAGSVSSSIVVVVIAGIIVLMLIYRKRNNKETGRMYQNVPFPGNRITNKRKRSSVHMEETFFEGLQDVDDVPIIINERTEYCNSPDVIEKIDRIKVSELFSYISSRSEDSFEADYQKLPTGLQKPCTFARKPENIALNRYNGIYPYDHSRVKLHGQPDFFINACYIDGYKSSKEYIASLGPTGKTTDDFKTFWKMIWFERVDVIVMLTNLREPSGMKCEKYWPEGDASIWYGDVCVSSVTTKCFAEYTIRQLSVSKEEDRRSLTLLHYTAWPDKTVPEDVTSLIEFRQRIKITPTSSDGPIVVHCSAGIGRTGTLIALDRLIEEGQDKGSINVFECVDSMREQRVKMVQTFEQYMYIYKALVNALTFDCETIPVETFKEYVDSTNNNMYSMMFQQLRQSAETDSKTDVEARWKNEKLTNKNRLGADIPGSRFRAMLYLNRKDEGSEYINAVYINSFVKRDYFVAAQSPLPCTVADFLTLVYQEDCSCIATMEDLKDPGMTVGQYLHDDKKTLTVGNFKVSSSRLETKHTHVVRKMKLIYSGGKFDSGEKTIYHFQYTKWMAGHDTPKNTQEFVQFVNDVKEYANEFGEERSHVLVHCLKANERSGLFCALAILMEKIKLERQVNVLNTLRHLRTRRQTAITSMEQLKFCFQATSEYIKKNMLG